jgi:predicted nicotinamide N-methyase
MADGGAAASAGGDGGRAYTASLTFRGRTVSLLQTPRDKTADGQDNTGWCVWEVSNIALRYLGADAHLSHVLAPPPAEHGGAAAGAAHVTGATTPGDPWRGLRVLDLSAGAGLVTLAVAAAGAWVVATDVPAQVPQLSANVAAGGADLAARVSVVPLFWGESLAPAVAAMERLAGPRPDAGGGAPPFDLVVASDILFIALRDSRTAELTATLAGLTRVARGVLFAFEERLFRQEDAYMRALGDTTVALADAVVVEEVDKAHCAVEYEDSLAKQGAGGHPDTDLWNPHLFWECPPVRMFIMRAAGERAP